MPPGPGRAGASWLRRRRYHVGVTHATPEDVAAAVLDTVPATMRVIRREVRASRLHGMSVPQFRILNFARRHPGSNLSAAAEYLGISLPAASQLVERLVRAGLLDRSVRPQERRHLELRVTEAGQEALAECDARTRAWLCDRLSALDGPRRDALAVALEDLRTLLADDPEPRAKSAG